MSVADSMVEKMDNAERVDTYHTKNISEHASAYNVDETYSFNVQTDDNAAFSSATTLGTNVRTYGNLTVNSTHVFYIDPGWAFERYTRIFFDGGGTTPTITGTIALMPLNAVKKLTLYPNNYTITH